MAARAVDRPEDDRIARRPSGRRPELSGTQAVPYPVAVRALLYMDDELEKLALEAGLAEARVERDDLAQLLVARAGRGTGG